MPRKLALKRLTASDLTLFKWHFQSHPAGKQKAFNLDAHVLVDMLYPALGDPSTVPNPRYPIDLYLLGPGFAPADNLQRKILKQQKNWRLNGELIDNPVDAPERYNILQPGDFALLEFSGDRVPDACSVTLIAAAESADRKLHLEFSRRYPQGSMWRMQEAEITVVVEAAQPAQGHPLHEWFESSALEDAALGGAAGIGAVNRRRGGRGMSPSEFARSRRAAEQTGVRGEEYLNGYFEHLLEMGKISAFEWTSSLNAISPFDFRVNFVNSQTRLVDAKSTSGDFENAIHLSYSELCRAVNGPEPYDIYRLYALTTHTAILQIALDVGPSLLPVLRALDATPDGVTVDSISIHPALLPFSGINILIGEEGVRDVLHE